MDAVKAPLVLILLGFPSSDARVRSVTGCLRKRSSCKVALGNYVLPEPVAAPLELTPESPANRKLFNNPELAHAVWRNQYRKVG